MRISKKLILLLAFTCLSQVGCDPKPNSYILKCHDRQDVSYADDDKFMRLASKAIYEDLSRKGKLRQLPKGAGPNSLYEMYLSHEDDFRMGVSRHLLVNEPHSNIYISYSSNETLGDDEVKQRRTLKSFIVSVTDCGVIDVL